MTGNSLSTLSRDQNAFLDELRKMGATSPASACPERSLPRLSTVQFRGLVDLGVVREASPGTFYVYALNAPADHGYSPPRSAALRKRAVQAAIFWLLVFLIPVAFIQCPFGRSG